MKLFVEQRGEKGMVMFTWLSLGLPMKMVSVRVFQSNTTVFSVVSL